MRRQPPRFTLFPTPTLFGSLADPYMSVRDSTGTTKLAESDDGGTGYNSHFTYTPTTTGNFFLAAGTGPHLNCTRSQTTDAVFSTPVAHDASNTRSSSDSTAR